MRRAGAEHVLMLGLLGGLLAGCATGKPLPSTSWLDRLRPLQGSAGPDVVRMQLALLEMPAGDPYLNRELWDLADEEGLPLDRKALLQDNGFRIGQVGGLTPSRLQRLLESEKSCISARWIELRPGTPKEVQLGPALPACRYLVQGGKAEEVNVEQAQCLLVVVPALTAGGRTTLRFTPQVRHGEIRHVPCPAPDHSGFVLVPQQPTEDYPGLGWEVTLAANEYVVVGGRFDAPETLGHQCFVRDGETPPVQRLLVIRTGGKPAGVAADGLAEAGESARRCPPIASHASWTAVRGSSR